MEGSWYSKKQITLGEDCQTLIKATNTNERGTCSKSIATVKFKQNCNKFFVDYSKDGKAICKECKKLIANDDLRLGMHVPFKKIHIFNNTVCPVCSPPLNELEYLPMSSRILVKLMVWMVFHRLKERKLKN